MSTQIVKKKTRDSALPVETLARIKLLYMSEKPLHQIESLTGVPQAKIVSLCSSKGWAKERKRMRAQIALVTEAEVKQLETRKKSWIKGKIDDAVNLNGEAKKMIDYAITAKDVKTFEAAVRTYDKIDTIFRRNTGLDAEAKRGGDRSPLQVNLIVGNNFDPNDNRAVEENAIDVETEDMD